jgi:anti-anti-sigma factor
VAEYSCFLRGDIDVSNADEQFALVRAASQRHTDTVTIDCMDLLFIDAAGLHALVTLSNELREQGRDLRLVHVSPFHRRVLDVLELRELLADPDPVNTAATS